MAGLNNTTEDFGVGVARYVVFYRERGRQLAFSMEHEEGSGRGVLHICVEPMPRWCQLADFSDSGPVAEAERTRILDNIERSLSGRLYTCAFYKREGLPFAVPP